MSRRFLTVDTGGVEDEICGDVVADSVATYSDDPDAFADFSASAVAGRSQPSRHFFNPRRRCSMLVVALDETSLASPSVATRGSGLI